MSTSGAKKCVKFKMAALGEGFIGKDSKQFLFLTIDLKYPTRLFVFAFVS